MSTSPSSILPSCLMVGSLIPDGSGCVDVDARHDCLFTSQGSYILCKIPVTRLTLYILTYLLSHDINIPDVVACANTLNTWSEPHRLRCLRGSMAAYAGDRGSNPAARTILVVFFRFLLLGRYVPNVAKRSVWEQCNIEDRRPIDRPTNDRPRILENFERPYLGNGSSDLIHSMSGSGVKVQEKIMREE